MYQDYNKECLRIQDTALKIRKKHVKVSEKCLKNFESSLGRFEPDVTLKFPHKYDQSKKFSY